MKKLINKYGCELTMHGLNRFYAGQSTREKFFWMIVWLGAMAFSGYFFSNLAQMYFNYNCLADIAVHFHQKMDLPKLTLCSRDIFWSKFICYNGKFSYKAKGNLTITLNCPDFSNLTLYSIEQCVHFGGDNFFCSKKVNSTLEGMCIELNSGSSVLKQGAAGRAGQLMYDIVYTPPNLPDSSQLYQQMLNQSFLYIDAHDEIVPISKSADVNYISPGTEYTIQVNRQDMKRLKHPYQSNCTDGKKKGTKHLDFFPGKYSIKSCRESCYLENMYRKCGAVNDFWKSYLPKHLVAKYKVPKKNETEIRLCIFEFHNNEYWDAPKDCNPCPLSCEQTMFDIQRLHENSFPNNNIRIRIFYQDLRVMEITEKPAYTASELIADFGGMLGLLAGGSLISIVEIITFILFMLFHKFYEWRE